MKSGNLFDASSGSLNGEQFTELLAAPGLRVERIVSTGQASPPGFWYDQAWAEWVLVISGEAALQFEDEPEPVHLKPGDYLLIPAHRRHRVVWTASAVATTWLAIHFDSAR